MIALCLFAIYYDSRFWLNSWSQECSTSIFSLAISIYNQEKMFWEFVKLSPEGKCPIAWAGLVNFAIRLVIFVFNLPDAQVLFFGGNSNYRRTVINPVNQKGFWC